VHHVFVDESKRAGYVLAAVTTSDPAVVRKAVRGLIVPGRRRLHMHNEHARRRRSIVDMLTSLPITVVIYDAARHHPTERAARTSCLSSLIADLARPGPDVRLVLEQDDSLVRADRHDLYRLTHEAGCHDRVEYGHARAHGELALALPDVAAWCWARSGEWRRRIAPVVSHVRQV
jgi:hypothetical protein